MLAVRSTRARLASMSDEASFMFADLAGFTAMTEAHGDESAADLAEEFCQLVRELLPAHGAEEIKLIGDAIMLRVLDAGDAVRLGLQIVCLRHGSPAVRVGMHTGPAVERSGDWYGATVNVAARVAAVAAGGEVLLTGKTREVAGSLAGVVFAARGSERFKNVGEPIAIHAAASDDPSSTREWPIDPVCRMAVDPSRCAGVLTHGERQYSFCSMTCIRAFAETPVRYTETATT